MSEIQIVKVDQGAVNARILAKEAKACLLYTSRCV